MGLGYYGVNCDIHIHTCAPYMLSTYMCLYAEFPKRGHTILCRCVY